MMNEMSDKIILSMVSLRTYLQSLRSHYNLFALNPLDEEHKVKYPIYVEAFDTVISRINKKFTENTWIDVNEQLPEEFENVLLFGKKYNGEPLIEIGYLNPEFIDDYGIQESFSIKAIITHWQPLPEHSKE